MMNVLITGSSGMLGTALCDLLSKDGSYTITGLDVNKRPPSGMQPLTFIPCDINDYAQLAAAVRQSRPDIIVHTAAYTDVDGCELNHDKAHTINSVGTQYVAKAAQESSAGLIYISTDFVFDGEKRSPYTEEDPPNPLNTYGKSKLEGEKYVMEIMKNTRFFIIRTSWLFGIGGKNFVDTILKKAKQDKVLRVVSNQFGSPTYAADLAGAIKNMLSLYGTREDIYGIYHITNGDDCSWYRLAQKALELSRHYGVELIPIVSTELVDRPAERPAMSILDNTKYIKLTGKPMRRWENALEEYVRLRRKRHV